MGEGYDRGKVGTDNGGIIGCRQVKPPWRQPLPSNGILGCCGVLFLIGWTSRMLDFGRVGSSGRDHDRGWTAMVDNSSRTGARWLGDLLMAVGPGDCYSGQQSTKS